MYLHFAEKELNYTLSGAALVRQWVSGTAPQWGREEAGNAGT